MGGGSRYGTRPCPSKQYEPSVRKQGKPITPNMVYFRKSMKLIMTANDSSKLHPGETQYQKLRQHYIPKHRAGNIGTWCTHKRMQCCFRTGSFFV